MFLVYKSIFLTGVISFPFQSLISEWNGKTLHHEEFSTHTMIGRHFSLLTGEISSLLYSLAFTYCIPISQTDPIALTVVFFKV